MMKGKAREVSACSSRRPAYRCYGPLLCRTSQPIRARRAAAHSSHAAALWRDGHPSGTRVMGECLLYYCRHHRVEKCSSVRRHNRSRYIYKVGEQQVKRALTSSDMAENILKLELTHHNLISESVRHFSCTGQGREKGHRAVCRSASLKCVNLMQKFQGRKLIQMILFSI